MEAGIKVNVEDAEGNTTLHVKSYGETGNLSELDVIEMLVENEADLVVRNNRVTINTNRNIFAHLQRVSACSLVCRV